MTTEQRRTLLSIARQAVEAAVSGQPARAVDEDLPAEICGGAFVTLRSHGRLRGCMGTFTCLDDLGQTIQEVAQLAARDPRFVNVPITRDELPELDVEISILSPAERVADPMALELGKHGILIERGAQRGCFLPHVASEFGWTKEEFLARCCNDKASLPADAWKDPGTVVSLFTAEVFSEV